MDTVIRPATADDLPVIQILLRQLGYELTAEETQRRFQAVASAPGHCLLVAMRGGRAAGLLHVYARPALDKPPEAIVQALVVDADARNGGIGRRLMVAAETWARAQGFASVALASSIHRDGAHAFYEAIGYARFATSHLFRKTLA
jgi:GNAT superfamily N-acetyltransferase